MLNFPMTKTFPLPSTATPIGESTSPVGSPWRVSQRRAPSRAAYFAVYELPLPLTKDGIVTATSPLLSSATDAGIRPVLHPTAAGRCFSQRIAPSAAAYR